MDFAGFNLRRLARDKQTVCGKFADHQHTYEIWRTSVMSSMNRKKQSGEIGKSLDEHQPLVGPMKKNHHHNRPFDAEKKDKMKQPPPPKNESHNIDAV
jgi:hypothetical protein